MASEIIGRAACPECGFASAHVKQSAKCLFRYCPECHTQTFAKSALQQANMRKGMRPVEGEAPAPAPVPAAPAPAPAPVPAPTGSNGLARPPLAPAPRRGLFTAW